MRLQRPPQFRLGLCCGDACREKRDDVVLYPVNPDRWRCANCYKAETGYWHWLTPGETKAPIGETNA